MGDSFNANGVKYHYNDYDDDGFSNNYRGDEEEQSLVPNDDFERDDSLHKKVYLFLITCQRNSMIFIQY